MLKHLPNKGKPFPLTHWEGKSLNIHSVQQCTGWGETLVAVLRKTTSRYVYAQQSRPRELRPEVSISTPKRGVRREMKDFSRNPAHASCRAWGELRWPLDQHVHPAIRISPSGRAQPGRSSVMGGVGPGVRETGVQILALHFPIQTHWVLVL